MKIVDVANEKKPLLLFVLLSVGMEITVRFEPVL